jgi:amino acid adenylation domain-containing protein
MSLALPADLNALQAAIWLDQQLFAGRPIYNTGQVLSIRGKLRFDLFESALREVVAESPGLRLPPRSGPLTFDLGLLDLRAESDPAAAADRWMRSEMSTPIPLDDGTLFRFTLITIGNEHTLWFQKFHHIIMDATSRRLLGARTAARYRALRFGDPLAPLNAASPETLFDLEQHYTASENHARDRGYWLEQFARWPGPLVETDRQNTERARSGVHGRVSFALKPAEFSKLEFAARSLNSSAARAILALTYVAFARLYGRYDIVLGFELANRSDAMANQAIGLLARPAPMLLTLDPAVSVADAVRAIDERRAQNYPHRHFPVQDIVREIGITRKGHHGLFDVIVNYVPLPYDFSFEDSPVEITNLSYGFATPWAVTVANTSLDRDINVTVDFDPGQISHALAAQMASCIETLLLSGLDDPSCPIGALPIMGQASRERVLRLASGEAAVLPETETLTSLCTAQAERTPDAAALIFGTQQINFVTLHARAARLARRLAALGVGTDVIVGIALHRGPDLVVAVLAVHKAGGAYLALDPGYPAERIRFMVADARAPVILTHPALAHVFADCGARLVTDIEAAEPAAEAEPSPAGPDDLAYVLYTSGSTGRPKAVGIAHRNVVNLVCWGRSLVSDAELRGILFSTSLNFDLSAFELFLPLAFGGCIVLVENVLALQSAPQRDKVRLINTGPSLFDALLRANALPPAVTTIILAGEKLPRRLADAIFAAAPGARLLNCYGPTETTVYSSCAVVGPADQSEPTIGRAIWNTELHVLDRGRALLPPGVEGELFIGGAGVGRGYLGRPELTADRFLPNLYGPGRLYRTGDRVRWRPDGELEFLGRADDQIKINGIRVEPGEIEEALRGLPGIAAAAVKYGEDAAGKRRLAAYLVASPGAATETANVRAALVRQLPPNMVPAAFVWLDAMPMTPNGKLDRKALPPAPHDEDARPALNPPPATRLEREIAGIWENLLRISPIGARSDFFDLGGDSLALVSLFATIEARFGRHLTVDVLAGGLTIAGLAQTLAEGGPNDAADKHAADPVVALQASGDLPPFFCVHGIGGDVLHLHRLAVHMGTHRRFLALRRPPDAPLASSISDMAARYVAAMLVHQPTGPFYLGGHSFGAMIAYEMALQLVDQGHEVGLVAIIDQRRPGFRLTARNALPILPRIIVNLPDHLRNELAQVPRAKRLRHLRRILRRWWRAALGIRPGVAEMFDLSGREPGEIALYEAHIRALRAYRPRSSNVPLALFRATVQLPLSELAMDETLGWSDLAGSAVRVHIVPGNHGSIMTEPLVRQLAKTLADELDAAQAIASRRRSSVAPMVRIPATAS